VELKEGMYVRSRLGIGKIIKVDEDDVTIDFSNITIVLPISNTNIYKTSYNIVDLIKKDDILLGNDGKMYQCWKIYKGYVFTYSKNKEGQTITLVDYQINRVLTKEQFESMAYKVGD